MVRFGRSMIVLGGARSGKSRYAQAAAEEAGGRLVFIATAQAFDQEMTDRIQRHRLDRDDRWETVEAPIDLADALAAADRIGTVVLIDCLTLWTSNLLLAGADFRAASTSLCSAVGSIKGRAIFVANEVGFGIVPDNELARRFRDAAGELNQLIARVCEDVHLVVAGHPIFLKQTG